MSGGASLPADADNSGSATRQVAADRSDFAAPVARDVGVIVVPASPSRIAPPSISFLPPPEQGTEIVSIRWIVNGSDRAEGPALSPDLFERGDEIGAEVIMRSENGDTHLATEKVVAVNALPAVTEVGIEPRAPVSGGTVHAIVTALDPDGDSLTFRYRWFVDNVAVPGEGASLVLNGVRKGSFVHVAVTPNDGIADGAWKYSPRHEIVNGPPVVSSKAPTTIPPSRVLVYTIVAEDPDGDPLSYSLVKGNERMSLSGSTLTWNVSDEDIGNAAEIVIRISDNQGGETVLTMNLTPKLP